MNDIDKIFDLGGKVAVVTGGGDGIGRAQPSDIESCIRLWVYGYPHQQCGPRSNPHECACLGADPGDGGADAVPHTD